MRPFLSSVFAFLSSLLHCRESLLVRYAVVKTPDGLPIEKVVTDLIEVIISRSSLSIMAGSNIEMFNLNPQLPLLTYICFTPSYTLISHCFHFVSALLSPMTISSGFHFNFADGGTFDFIAVAICCSTKT